MWRAILVILAVIAALMTYGTVQRGRLFYRLIESRKGYGFAEFAASLPGVPDAISRKVYDYVQRYWAEGYPGFPVSEDDSIDLFLLDEGVLEASISELAEACGKEKPLLNIWAGTPISTVGNIARIIAHLPTPEEVQVEGSRRLWTDRD